MRRVLALVLVAGCYKPTIPDGAFLCGDKQQCPDGLTCRLGQCVAPGEEGCPDDAQEPNDSIDTAVAVPVSTEALTLCPFNEDWYAFEVTGGGFRAELDVGSIGGHLVVSAYDSAGVLLAAAEDDDLALIDLPEATVGMYTLRVAAAKVGGSNSYALRVRVPASDLCEYAEVWTADTSVVVGNTAAATNDSTNPAAETVYYCSTANGADVNYRLDTVVPVRVSGWVSANFAWQVYVADGCPVSPLNTAASAVGSAGSGCDGESFVLEVDKGSHIIVLDGSGEGEGNSSGDYAISLRFDAECTTSADCGSEQFCATGTCTDLEGSRYSASDLPVAIEDCDLINGECVTIPTVSQVEVAVSQIIAGFDVRVDLNHTFRQDLRIELQPPGMAAFVLREGCGDCGKDIHGVFPSELPIRDAAAAQALVGTDAAGTWTLIVTDTQDADEGELTGWSLYLR